MTSTSDIFHKFEDLKVLVVGDVMIDRYLTGQVNRISPEAPVPVIHLQEQDNRLGGAANVALNIHAMGADAILCSVVGNDENGRQLLELLPDAGLSSAGIFQSKDRCTTVKTRVIAQNQHLLRVDREDSHDLNSAETQKLLTIIRRLLDKTKIDLILFQDYNKGVLTREVIREVIREAKSRNIPTAVDPKKKNIWNYVEVDLFKPNLKEIRESVPFAVQPEPESLSRAAAYVRETLHNKITLITLSEKGLFIDNEGDGHIIPTEARSIADVCGAGDTVISLAALGMAAHMDFRSLAQLANLAGGQVCERVGVVPVDLRQLKKEYQALLLR